MCVYCESLRKERQPIIVTEINIAFSGYYNRRTCMNFCPECGESMNRASEKEKENKDG